MLNLTFTHYYETKKTPHFSLAQRNTETFFFFSKRCNFKNPSGSSSWVRTVFRQQFLSFNCSLFSSPSLLFLILLTSTDPWELDLSLCPLCSSRVFCPTRQTNLTWDPSFLGDSYCPPGKTEQVKDLCFIVVNPGVARLHPARGQTGAGAPSAACLLASDCLCFRASIFGLFVFLELLFWSWWLLFQDFRYGYQWFTSSQFPSNTVQFRHLSFQFCVHWWILKLVLGPKEDSSLLWTELPLSLFWTSSAMSRG